MKIRGANTLAAPARNEGVLFGKLPSTIEHATQAGTAIFSINDAVGSGVEGHTVGGEMDSKTFFCADTFEELFEYLGMAAESIPAALASVETYNAAAEAGVDNEFGSDPASMCPLNNPPFYGWKTSCRAGGLLALCTTSGLLVNGNQQVQGQGIQAHQGPLCHRQQLRRPVPHGLQRHHKRRVNRHGTHAGYDAGRAPGRRGRGVRNRLPEAENPSHHWTSQHAKPSGARRARTIEQGN